jgi:RNA polymerase sigma-70 factor (ECF subfamily)
VSKSDEQLYQEILQGSQQAFSLLYHRYFDKLCWFAQQYLYSKAEAEDIVQEVFTKIIESPKLFDASQKFNTWIFTLTANRCKNTLRNEINRSRLQQENLAIQDTQEASNAYDAALLKSQLSKVYKTLSEKEKKLFVLRFEQSYNTKEIANILDIPEGSVKSGLFYLLKKIKESLSSYAG